MKCWGLGNTGQLGSGSTETIGDQPDEIENMFPVDHGKGIALDVSVDYRHTCIIDDTRRIKCWGENTRGELGLGTTEPRVGDQANEMGGALPLVDFAQILSFD